MKPFGLILSCITLAACTVETNPELAKPTGFSATPLQVAAAKETSGVQQVTMMVKPSHDLDTGPPTSEAGQAVFSEGNVTFDCDLVSFGKDARGKSTVTLRLKGMSDVPHVNDTMFVLAKPSVDLITVSSSKLHQISVAKRKLSVTVRRTGDVAVLNAEPLDGYYAVTKHVKLPDGRYQLSMSDEKKSKPPIQVIVDQMDRPDMWVDFFSLTSRGWKAWTYEKGPGSSDLSWLTSQKGRGAFD